MSKSVLDRIRSGELSLCKYHEWDSGDYYTKEPESNGEAIDLMELGERMRWIDGKPPDFGPDERKWIVFEYLTSFLKTKSYVTAVWLGTSYSEVKVKLARRWMLLPEPPAENDRPEPPKEAE
jgi:hypothetical protein